MPRDEILFLSTPLLIPSMYIIWAFVLSCFVVINTLYLFCNFWSLWPFLSIMLGLWCILQLVFHGTFCIVDALNLPYVWVDLHFVHSHGPYFLKLYYFLWFPSFHLFLLNFVFVTLRVLSACPEFVSFVLFYYLFYFYFRTIF